MKPFQISTCTVPYIVSYFCFFSQIAKKIHQIIDRCLRLVGTPHSPNLFNTEPSDMWYIVCSLRFVQHYISFNDRQPATYLTCCHNMLFIFFAVFTESFCSGVESLCCIDVFKNYIPEKDISFNVYVSPIAIQTI